MFWSNKNSCNNNAPLITCMMIILIDLVVLLLTTPSSSTFAQQNFTTTTTMSSPSPSPTTPTNGNYTKFPVDANVTTPSPPDNSTNVILSVTLMSVVAFIVLAGSIGLICRSRINSVEEDKRRLAELQGKDDDSRINTDSEQLLHHVPRHANDPQLMITSETTTASTHRTSISSSTITYRSPENSTTIHPHQQQQQQQQKRSSQDSGSSSANKNSKNKDTKLEKARKQQQQQEEVVNNNSFLIAAGIDEPSSKTRISGSPSLSPVASAPSRTDEQTTKKSDNSTIRNPSFSSPSDMTPTMNVNLAVTRRASSVSIEIPDDFDEKEINNRNNNKSNGDDDDEEVTLLKNVSLSLPSRLHPRSASATPLNVVQNNNSTTTNPMLSVVSNASVLSDNSNVGKGQHKNRNSNNSSSLVAGGSSSTPTAAEHNNNSMTMTTRRKSQSPEQQREVEEPFKNFDMTVEGADL